MYVHTLEVAMYVCMISKLTIVSREAKKKQALCNERVSYLQVAPL